MMYQVFMSPLTNKEEWKAAEKNNDFLSYNLFKASVSINGYISLLKSLQHTGKKKHLKKVIAHMSKYLTKEELAHP